MNRPDVSVLLATRDRDSVLEATLTHCVRTVASSRVSVEFVVVDNGSVDDTTSVLERFSEALPLVALSEPRPGKNRALTLGLAAARAPLVVFTDDDVVPADGWLDELWRASREWPEHDVFGGRVIPRYPPDRGPAFSDRGFAEWAYSHWEPDQDEGPTDALPLGPNFAVRADSLAEVTLDATIGPGSESGAMGSETTLIKSLLDRGSSIVYVPGSTVEHLVTPDQLSRTYLLRRAFRLGRGLARWDVDDHSPRLAGVPRYLWREVASTWVASRLPWRDDLARFEARLAHQRAKGAVAEYRASS
jgi:glycosyltransferase involved in cell wall biosynthesis